MLWGDNAYVRFGIITAGIVLVLWAVVSFMQHALWRQLSEMDPSQRDFLRAEEPEIEEFLGRPAAGR